MDQSVLDQMKADIQTAIDRGDDELATPITFYSSGSSRLTIGCGIGKVIFDAGGHAERIGEKAAEFQPIAAAVKQADGSNKFFGYYVATDPHIAMVLLIRGYFPDKKRNNQILGDVLLSADYYEQITPSSELLRSERARLVASENELERYMREQSQKDVLLSEKDEQILRLQAQLMTMANNKGKGKPVEEAVTA